MIHVIIAESRKLRRPTLLFSTMAITVVLSGLFTSLLFLLINSKDGNGKRGQMISPASLSLPNGVVTGFTSTATLLGIVALCIFAAQTAQEYTFGTLRNLLVRQPSRMKILGGKYISMIIFAIVMDVLSLIISVIASYALAGHAHVTTVLWSSGAGYREIGHAFLNVLITTLGFGTLGMILGLALRSPISSIAIGVIWVLIVENLLALAVKKSGPWLPGYLISNVAEGGSVDISYQRGLLLGGAYLLVGGAVVSYLFKKRDVSN